MRLFKTVSAGLAATGLILASPVMAQDVPVDEMGVPQAAQPLVFLLGIVAFAVVLGVLFEDDDDNGSPISP